MNTILFSIILPTYNRAEFLSVAIDSVLNQIYPHWELILIDDGSTDNTKEIINKYNDKRIRYIYQENAERSTARNNGIKNANGQYLCFLDSDDYYLPNFLENFYLHLSSGKEKKCILISNYTVQQDANQPIKINIFNNNINAIVNYIFENNLTILSQTICCCKEFFEYHLFNENYILWEDTHLWIRAFSILPYSIIPTNDVMILQHTQSTVMQGLLKINKHQVNQYIEAINNLFNNYKDILPNTINKHHRINYIDAKYQMYIYQARCNRQWILLIFLVYNAIKNKKTFVNILLFPKLVLWRIF